MEVDRSPPSPPRPRPRPERPRPWTDIWHPVSEPEGDHGALGWVSTFEEACEVKKHFEVFASLMFVSERHNSFPEGPKQRIRFSDSVIEGDGTPFFLRGRWEYSCMFGRDKHAARIKNAAEEEKRQHKQDHPSCKKKAKEMQSSKKMGCPAKLHMREVACIMDFKADKASTTYQQKRTSQRVKEAMARGDALQIEKRIYIQLPSDEDHKNVHSLGEVTGFRKPINKQVSAKLDELVAHGVSSVGEMRRHLKVHVETVLFPEAATRPPLTNAGYYPSDKTMGDVSSSSQEGREACDKADPESSGDDQAVVLLEKTAFTEDLLPTLMSEKSILNRSMQNDIYGVYECFPPKEPSGIKTTLIYRATEKHIQKYSAQDVHIINESYKDYKNITLPYIEEKQFNIQLVYNILEKKAESERIIFEDPDPETGFVMLPDMIWDEKQTDNLYLIVIIHQQGIKSLRDLKASHLPLLRNIQEKCSKCIQEKYSIPADELRAYLHYQPSYYHLHVHFTHLKFNAPGTNVGRAHLLSSVIENIELMSDYYQRKPLSYVLQENDGLLAEFREARCGNGQ